MPQSTKDRIPFIEIAYRGARFSGGRLPVEVLSDLSTYQEMLIDIAKQIWKENNLNRTRIPKHFGQYFQLTFSEVTNGSAVAHLPREDFDLSPLFGQDHIIDIFDLAQERLLDAIDCANSGNKIESLSENFMPKFNNFGRSLEDNEKMVFIPRSHASRTRKHNVYYTKKTRENILSSAGLLVDQKINGFGIIRGVSESKPAVTVLCELGEFEYKIPKSQVREVYDGKIGDIVEFSIEASIKDRKHIKKVLNFYSMDPIEYGADVERIEERLDSIRRLKKGWLDGIGLPVSDDVISTALDLVKFLNSVYADIRVYPQENGGVQIEFEHHLLDVSYELSPSGNILAHLYSSKNDKSVEKLYRSINAEILRDAMNLEGLF